METRLTMREVDGKEEFPSKHDVNPTGVSNSNQDGKENLVFDVVFRALNCPRLLRTCRLVCKAWNEFACSQLKLVATTKVAMCDKEFEQIKPFAPLRQLMDELKSGETLPSPFRKVSLKSLCMDETKFFNALAKYLGNDLILTELQLYGENYGRVKSSSHDTKHLMSVLRSQSRSLQVLTVGMLGDDELCRKAEEDLQEMQFPSLKKMKWSAMRLNFGKVFIQNIVLHSKLELLQLEFHKLNEWEELFRDTNFDNVAVLELETLIFSQPIKSADLIRVLAASNKPWRNLVRLNIPVATEQDVTQIVSWLQESLEVLHIRKARIPLDDLPKCPKLREIGSSSGYNGQLLPEKFPLLKRFYNHGSSPGSNLANIIPHYGVVQAQVTVNGLYSSLQHEDSTFCHFCLKWESWAEDFPTMKEYFQEHQVAFCEVSTALRKINKTFPQLKELSVDEHSDSNLTSIIVPNRRHCKSYRKEDILKLPLDSFTKEIFPFEGFLELEALDVSGIEVGPGLIISSLSKIPKLKYLRMDAYRKLTSEVVREYLGHLKEVALLDCANEEASWLAENERILMGEIEMPVIKLFCDYCGLCEKPLCCCQDCNRISLIRPV